ncbi:MAG: hypothetical protein M1822_001936 [Bathelium mastoideum]|nr:MAG: hypothetical protein M1822_001936 [Bathelium mastoideum]
MAKDRSEARELNDWTRKGPLPDLPNQRRASERPGFRNFDSGSDAGSERAERRRPPPFEGDGKVRDFGNWERKGPLSPVPPTGPALRDGGRLRASADGPRERRASPAWGEARSNEGSRPPKERPQYDRQPTAPELDNQWRARMKPDAPASSSTPTPEASVPSSPAGPAPAATRPKLNLSKRTVSEAEPGPLSASSETKSSIFGGAKPIDTATREREIDEKRQLVYRQKKEQDDKAREEKRVAKEAAAKAEKEKGAGSSSVAQDGAKNGSKNEEKENGTSTPQPGRNYEILRRMAEDNEDGAEGTNDGPANGLVSEDKEVKPKEVVRDMSNESEESTPGPTAESLEEDGFSTVTRKAKNNRRGGARALAS